MTKDNGKKKNEKKVMERRKMKKVNGKKKNEKR
jgi:hypothetical protein